MTKTSAFVLPFLALFNHARAFNVQRAPTSIFSRSYMCSTMLKMSNVEESPSGEKVMMNGYQVFVGNLPFSVDEEQLNGMVSERVQR